MFWQCQSQSVRSVRSWHFGANRCSHRSRRRGYASHSVHRSCPSCKDLAATCVAANCFSKSALAECLASVRHQTLVRANELKHNEWAFIFIIYYIYYIYIIYIIIYIYVNMQPLQPTMQTAELLYMYNRMTAAQRKQGFMDGLRMILDKQWSMEWTPLNGPFELTVCDILWRQWRPLSPHHLSPQASKGLTQTPLWVPTTTESHGQGTLGHGQSPNIMPRRALHCELQAIAPRSLSLSQGCPSYPS